MGETMKNWRRKSGEEDRVASGSRRTKTGHRPARGGNDKEEDTIEERRQPLTCMPMTAYMKNSITISRAT